jgi:hypothetical protein
MAYILFVIGTVLQAFLMFKILKNFPLKLRFDVVKLNIIITVSSIIFSLIGTWLKGGSWARSWEQFSDVQIKGRVAVGILVVEGSLLLVNYFTHIFSPALIFSLVLLIPSILTIKAERLNFGGKKKM